MGLFGSTHCVVMCGPLILALDRSVGFSWRTVFGRIVYQLGRILTYAIWGFLLGYIGNVAAMQGWQQYFSIFIGVLLVFLGVFFTLGNRSSRFVAFQSRMIGPLAKYMGKWLNRPGGNFIAGILNGVLPCGMVYMALISATSADSVLHSTLFMVLFGIGTLPLLLLFSFLSQLPKLMFKQRFAKILPVLYFIMGVWFILRGANLDIPFLSPLLHIEGALHCA